ncbi:MAG: tripartite tricarboxylate transporter substrate-binding protein [Burkholderiales bacterium]
MSLCRSLVIATLACAVGAAAAQTAAPVTAAWPSKPLRLIVGYTSGSSPDVQARPLAEPLSKALGQMVLVENERGAGGSIGADAVAKAVHGHTIGVVAVLPLVQDGKLDALAVSLAQQRSSLARMLPGMRELGADAVDIEVWNAVVAPATLPAVQTAHLSAMLKAILETPALRDKLLSQGWQAADPSPQALARRIASDAASYRGVIENNQIKLD